MQQDERRIGAPWQRVLRIGVAALACTASALMGQPPGDWNGDGQVTPADAVGLDSCMLGPGVSPSAACGVFVVGNETEVSLRSALAMQLKVEVQTSPCTTEVTYALGLWIYEAIYGASAYITSHQPSLCGQPAATTQAFSAAYVSIARILAYEPRPIYWAQAGYIRYRSIGTRPFNPQPPPTTTIATAIYFEYNGGHRPNSTSGVDPGPIYDRVFRRAPQSAPVAEEYWVHIPNPFSLSGRIEFFVLPPNGDNIVYEYPSPPAVGGWAGRIANRATFAAEKFNRQDRFVGTAANPCRFTTCQYEAGAPYSFTSTEFIAGDDTSAVTSSGDGSVRASGDRVEVWDTRP